MKRRLHGCLTVVLAAALVVLLFVAIDAVCARWVETADPYIEGLAMTPGMHGRIETVEFSTGARLNRLGFRDRDVAVERSGKRRIVAIGDSFTFGWGVEAEESWPKGLESRLHDTEVLNLGVPGAGPPDYYAIAARAVPLLKPDLVVLALLQADDLQQCLPQRREQRTWLERFAVHPLPTLYPNLTLLIKRGKRRHHMANPFNLNVHPQVEWKKQASQVVGSLTADQKLRWERIDEKTRRQFLAGQLNASWITLALRNPDYFTRPMDASDTGMQAFLEQQVLWLHDIKRLTEAHGARLLVVSLPGGMYCNRPSWEKNRQLGFDIVPEMLTTDKPDYYPREATRRAGVAMVPLLDTVRQSAARQNLYFLLDGHPNAEGYRVMGEALVPAVR